MSTATQPKFLTVLELFLENIPQGQLATCVSDNDLHGITVKKQGDTLIDVRTNIPLPLSKETLSSQFELVYSSKEITLNQAIELLVNGEKVKVVLGDKSRIVLKPTVAMKSFENAISTFFGASNELSLSTMITVEELEYGKFYTHK